MVLCVSDLLTMYGYPLRVLRTKSTDIICRQSLEPGIALWYTCLCCYCKNATNQHVNSMGPIGNRMCSTVSSFTSAFSPSLMINKTIMCKSKSETPK